MSSYGTSKTPVPLTVFCQPHQGRFLLRCAMIAIRIIGSMFIIALLFKNVFLQKELFLQRHRLFLTYTVEEGKKFNMYRLRRKKHVLLMLLCLACLFVACSGNAQTTAPFLSPFTAQSSQTVPKTAQLSPTATETAKSMQNPSSTPSVKVTTDSPQYATNESITVLITNGLSASIYASAYYTQCTPVQLQIRSATTWNMIGRCPESTQSALVIQSGSAKSLVLRPSIGSMRSRVHSGTKWATGTYRISFNYTLQPDPDSSRGGIQRTSEEFTIH
jgi:hypothetical protein